MRLVITGVPGTGKTEVAGILSKRLKCKLVAANKLVSSKKLWSGTGKFGEKIALMGKLRAALQGVMKAERIIVEGHLACEFKLPADWVVVLRADPDVLEKRLAKRGYPAEKIDENVFAEMLDYCTTCAAEHYGAKKVIEFDTTAKSAKESAAAILPLLGGKKTAKSVDWSGKLSERLSRPFPQ